MMINKGLPLMILHPYFDACGYEQGKLDERRPVVVPSLVLPS